MGEARCLLRLRVEFGEVARCQMRGERKHLHRGLNAHELGIDGLHERARGADDVALQACALLRIRTHDQERRNDSRGQNAGEDQIIEPEADCSARGLYPRCAHDIQND
jgi:hypothetical protein